MIFFVEQDGVQSYSRCRRRNEEEKSGWYNTGRENCASEIEGLRKVRNIIGLPTALRGQLR